MSNEIIQADQTADNAAHAVVGDDPVRMWGDAKIMTAGWDPEADPRLSVLTVITQGPKAESNNWKTKHLPLGAVLAQMCRHTDGPKDGPGFVGGEVIGERRKAVAMKQLSFAGLDVDTGMKPEAIDAVLRKHGRLGVRYTTHSNSKTETEFLKSKVVKFAQDKGYDPEDISIDLLKEFMTEVGKFEAYVVDSIDSVDEDQTEKGFVVRVGHCPIPKNRIVFPLFEPFIMAKEANVQKDAIEKWKKIPTALARELGVPIDSTGIDPSRLFYYPRHKKGRPFECAIFGGELFDWRTLELDDPFLAAAAEMEKGNGKSKSKSKTAEGQALGKWSIARAQGFQIAEVIRNYAEDRIRAEVSAGLEIECPFDEDHSNAGDPEDRACLAVNAGDGPSEVFTVSCRHESCQGRTNLDMLGKMLKDGWFEEAAIHDEDFNALAPEETSQPKVAKRIVEEQKAKTGLPDMIAGLSEDSSADDIEAVVAEAGKLQSPIAQGAAAQQIKKKIGTAFKVTELRAMIKAASRKDAPPPEPESKLYYDEKLGRHILSYYGTVHEDEVVQAINTVMLAKNDSSKWGTRLPHFSVHNDIVMLLRGDPAHPVFKEASLGEFEGAIGPLLSTRRRTDQGDGPREHADSKLVAHAFRNARLVLPTTPRIQRVPGFGAEWELLDSDGWKEASNVYVALGDLDMEPVPERPTAERVAAAVDYLRTEVLGDFCFGDVGEDGKLSRGPGEANALAFLLTPLIRHAFSGCTPLFLVSKPSAGSGGTMLGKLPILLTTGREVFPNDYPRNDEEFQKEIVACLRDHIRYFIFYDNVRHLTSKVLLQNLTSEMMGGRLLGSSQNVEGPNDYIWVATGINPVLNAEMNRRCVFMNLNTLEANNADRKYRHEDFRSWILDNRGTILHKLLTLVANWRAQGGKLSGDRLPSFEAWSRTLGGILEAASVEGFLRTPKRPIVDFAEQSEQEFVSMWFGTYKCHATAPATLLAMAEDHVEGRSDSEKKRAARNLLQRLTDSTHMLNGLKHTVVKTADGYALVASETLK